MVALVAGAAVGLGVGVLVYLVAVPQRPALAPLMKLAGSRPQPALSIDVCRSRSAAAAPAAQLLATATQWVDVDWLTSPDADLAVIEKIPPAIPAGTGGTDSDRALHRADLGGDDVGIGCRIAVGDSTDGKHRVGGGVLVPGNQPGAGGSSGTPP